MTPHVHSSGEGREAPSLLPFERRVELLVLLGRANADRQAVASRLIVLGEHAADRIDLELTVAGQPTQWREKLPFALVLADSRAELYVAPGVRSRRMAVALVLADYLGVGDHAHLITLLLAAPEELIESILDGERQEAAALLGGPDDDVGDEEEVVADHQEDSDHDSDRDNESGGDSQIAVTGTTEASADSDGGTEEKRAGFDGRVAGDRTPSRPGGGSGIGRERRLTGAPVVDIARVQFGPSRPPVFADPAPRQTHDRPASPKTGSASGPQAFDAPGGAPRSDEEIERAAVELVMAYANRELGVEAIADRQDEKIGWDLDFFYSDGTHQRVEVKGSGGQGPVGLTVNELKAARLHDNYVLFFAAELRGDAPKLYRFDGLGSAIDEQAHLQPSAYWVSGWRELGPSVVEIQAVA